MCNRLYTYSTVKATMAYWRVEKGRFEKGWKFHLFLETFNPCFLRFAPKPWPWPPWKCDPHGGFWGWGIEWEGSPPLKMAGSLRKGHFWGKRLKVRGLYQGHGVRLGNPCPWVSFAPCFRDSPPGALPAAFPHKPRLVASRGNRVQTILTAQTRARVFRNFLWELSSLCIYITNSMSRPSFSPWFVIYDCEDVNRWLRDLSETSLFRRRSVLSQLALSQCSASWGRMGDISSWNHGWLF